jgi:hypothetical protein
MVEVACIEAAEQKLLADLPVMVGELAVPRLVVPYENNKASRRLPPDVYELFTLKGLVNDLEPDHQLASIEPSDYSYEVSPKPRNVSSACLATRDAIGLGYEGELIAFAAAGISHSTGSIYVKQIAGISSDTKSEAGKHARRSVRWTETLIRAWAEVGSKVGLEDIELKTYAGVRFKEDLVQDDRILRMRRRHVRAAEYLKFEPATNGRWHQSVADLKKYV